MAMCGCLWRTRRRFEIHAASALEAQFDYRNSPRLRVSIVTVCMDCIGSRAALSLRKWGICFALDHVDRCSVGSDRGNEG